MTEMFQQKPVHERLRILVVEDSDVLREMFLKAFSSAHTIYAASGAKEGWKFYLDKDPNVVFMDIGLPDGSGHDLAYMIKERNPETYIVMATASHNIHDKKEAAHNRVDGFIAKPFNKKEINDYIDLYMANRCRDAKKK